MEESLIYIPPRDGRPHHCAAVKKCVLKGPDFLRRIYSLQNVYRTCMRLFSQVLDIENADLDTFVAEAKSITSGDQPDYVLQILQKINNLLELEESVEALELVRSLQAFAIFPVEQESGKPAFLSLTDEWFVADNLVLAIPLRGKIPFLALPGGELKKLKKLVRTLQIDHHFLSRNARRKVQIEGDSYFCEDRTNTLSAKAIFVAR